MGGGKTGNLFKMLYARLSACNLFDNFDASNKVSIKIFVSSKSIEMFNLSIFDYFLSSCYIYSLHTLTIPLFKN